MSSGCRGNIVDPVVLHCALQSLGYLETLRAAIVGLLGASCAWC